MPLKFNWFWFTCSKLIHIKNQLHKVQLTFSYHPIRSCYTIPCKCHNWTNSMLCCNFRLKCVYNETINEKWPWLLEFEGLKFLIKHKINIILISYILHSFVVVHTFAAQHIHSKQEIIQNSNMNKSCKNYVGLFIKHWIQDIDPYQKQILVCAGYSLSTKRQNFWYILLNKNVFKVLRRFALGDVNKSDLQSFSFL